MSNVHWHYRYTRETRLVLCSLCVKIKRMRLQNHLIYFSQTSDLWQTCQLHIEAKVVKPRKCLIKNSNSDRIYRKGVRRRPNDRFECKLMMNRQTACQLESDINRREETHLIDCWWRKFTFRNISITRKPIITLLLYFFAINFFLLLESEILYFFFDFFFGRKQKSLIRVGESAMIEPPHQTKAQC